MYSAQLIRSCLLSATQQIELFCLTITFVQTQDCDARIETVRRACENKVRETEREVQRAEQESCADIQRVREDVWALRSAYVQRMDLIDERVNDNKAEGARRASESLHRDQQLDTKMRTLEQKLFHQGSNTTASSALSLQPTIDAPSFVLSGDGFPLVDVGIGGGGVGVDHGMSSSSLGGIIGAVREEVAWIKGRLAQVPIIVKGCCACLCKRCVCWRTTDVSASVRRMMLAHVVFPPSVCMRKHRCDETGPQLGIVQQPS